MTTNPSAHLPDTARSLTELESQDWGVPAHDSHLVRECHRLRHVPLRDLTVEDLRLLIGQNIGLPYLLPVALDVLEKQTFAEGDYYPGDLLASCMRSSPDVFAQRPELRARQTFDPDEHADGTPAASFDSAFAQAVEAFSKSGPVE